MIPAFAILYPLLRGLGKNEFLEDENSPQAELARRWDAALAGLKNAELELALGNLDEDDHQWLRRQYMTEAALVLKGMRLEDEQEQVARFDVLVDFRLNALTRRRQRIFPAQRNELDTGTVPEAFVQFVDLVFERATSDL